MFQFQDIAQAAQALHAVQAAEKAEAEAEAAKPKVNQPHPNPWYKHYSIYPLGFALVINSLAIISLPWLPGTIVYLIQTSFPNSITGTLNGVSVINLNNLRFGIWAACYADAHHSIASQTCLPWGAAYDIVIIEQGGNAHTVVQGLWTIALKIQGLAALFTLVAFVCAFRTYFHWYTSVAAMVSGAVIVANYILFTAVRNSMQAIVPTASTITGPGFGWVAAATVLLILSIPYICAIGAMSEKKAQQAAAGKTAEQKATMERNVLFQTTQMPL